MDFFSTLLWYGGNIWEYTLQMLPCMGAALLVFVLVRPARRRRLAERGLYSPPAREATLLLFVMFCGGLAALTVFPAYFWTWDHWRAVLAGETALFPKAVDWRWQLQHAQLTPFQEIERGLRGPWVMFLVLANMGIFIPLGLFTSLLCRKPSWWKTTLTGFIFSFLIESVQLFIARSTDIDDVILNTAGALAGYGLFRLLRAAFPCIPAKFQCRKETERDG